MRLCDLCANLTIEKLYPPNIYYHADNLAAVERSAESCQLCKLLHWCIWRQEDENYRDYGLDYEPTYSDKEAEMRDNERWDKPELLFDGFTDEVTSESQIEERNVCPIKLQILPGKGMNLAQFQAGFKNIGIWMMSKYMISDITLSVEEGDVLGTRALTVDGIDRFIVGRVLASEYPTEAHLDIARRWLEECEDGHAVHADSDFSKHTECYTSAKSPAALPPRVVEVRKDGQNPRLVDGPHAASTNSGIASSLGSYATLSHCWGHLPTVKLTTSNITALRDSIDFDTLPKTFQDAIIMCRKLKIDYLWIDSLCIVQDDKSDWEHHARIMGSIFYDSSVTLAAADGSDSSKGLFIPKRPNVEYPWFGLIPLPKSFGGGRGPVYVTAPSSGMHKTTDLGYRASISILQSRGWVMQESALSRRTIHFLEGQMGWQCPSMTRGRGECDNDSKFFTPSLRVGLQVFHRAFQESYFWPDDSDEDQEDDEEEEEEDDKTKIPGEVTADDQETKFTPFIKPGDIIDLRDHAHRTDAPPVETIREESRPSLESFLWSAVSKTIYHVWYEGVSEYSDRRLTFMTDKLPALAGIASRVYDITADDYLAGHWRRELERSLLWRVETGIYSGHPSRLSAYRAPSWSWASVNASTSFEFADLSDESPVAIEVVDASVETDGENPFGCVVGGKLTIKANVMRASWQTETQSWSVKTKIKWMKEMIQDDDVEDDDLVITASNKVKRIVGKWKYDDVIHGVLPGPAITKDTALEEVSARIVPRNYEGAPIRALNIATHGPDANDMSSLWRRATYVPEHLLLVKGRTFETYTIQGAGHPIETTVLVLASIGEGNGEYRRVGIGSLSIWDTKCAKEEVLTIV